MKSLEAINNLIKRTKKRFIIHRATKARGGISVRAFDRLIRQQKIKLEKRKVKEDFIYSWRLGEIKAPSPEDHKIIFSEALPTWDFLLNLQKKYWRENI